MAERMGLVVVFKAGVTRAAATAALANLNGLVESKITYPFMKSHRFGDGIESVVSDYSRPVTTENPAEHIETFNDEHGGPVWYIP